MVFCSFVPEGFRYSYIVPLPKPKECYSKTLTFDDFRGIAISPVLSKIFEHYILDRFGSFLAKVHVRCRPSVYLSVCLTLVRPTQALKFSAIFLSCLVPWPSFDIRDKFYGDRPRGTPPSWELNIRGVAKHSDFGPIEGCISETVQDRR